MTKFLTFLLIIISLILHASILRVGIFSELNLILIIVLVLYEKFDFPNSILIFISLVGFALIEPSKTIGLVLLQYSLSFGISEIILKIFFKRSLKLFNLGELILVNVFFYLFETLVVLINNNLNVENVIKLIISLILNTLITAIVLNVITSKRRNRLEMPKFQ